MKSLRELRFTRNGSRIPKVVARSGVRAEVEPGESWKDAEVRVKRDQASAGVKGVPRMTLE